jgi:putative chitinase
LDIYWPFIDAKNGLDLIFWGDRVYSERMGNGDETSGDGYRYRGRGYLQITGKDNYAAFSKFIDEDCVTYPDLISVKYALASAAFFFDSHGLWKI